jgi:C-terminal processing protease CtpA/Prc
MRLASIVTILALAGTAFAQERREEPRPLTPNNANDVRQQYERQLKDFADTIEKLKDNPEAKEALEKARDEFKKAMEPKLKEANQAIPVAPGRGEPQVNPFLNNREFAQLQAMQQELLAERMNALRALQGFNALGRPSGRLGMKLEPVPAVLIEQMGLEKNVGVVLGAVAKDSAAEKAGLKVNDILLQVQGKDIPSDPAELVNQLSRLKEGEKLDFTILRKGKKEKVEGLVVPAEVRLPDPVAIPRVARGTRMTIVNGEVNMTMNFDGGVEIAVTGRFNKTGALDPTKFTIKDGNETIEAESLEKVPEKYRGRAEKLLGNASGPRRERER